MTTAISSPPPTKDRSAFRHCDEERRLRSIVRPSCRDEVPMDGSPLAGYLDADGRVRELLALPGHAGSVLVLDRDAVTLCDRRLVAHLAADEPRENAALVCRHYLKDAHGRWCRRVRREDLEAVPFAHNEYGVPADSLVYDTPLADMDGNVYCLRLLCGEHSSAQLRWCRHFADTEGSTWKRVGLRDVVAALESYEPARELTERAIERHHDDRDVVLTRLRSELERLCASPVVLNRGLREAVLDAIDRRGMSMSEIALRCGIVKHDRWGKTSGETSWLARRVGLMPEGGEKEITPWIHTDVLATIARQGLGISPREVELQ